MTIPKDPNDQEPASDATIVRPRSSSGPGAKPIPPPTPASNPKSTPAPTPNPRPVASVAPKAPFIELNTFLHAGLNPLVQLASPLLLLAVQLRHSVVSPSVAHLREQTVSQLRKFEQDAQAAGINAQTITAARYVLCTTLDESILNAPWGEQSGWSQQTLLTKFHNESYGGAKFFQILERLLADFSRHIDLIELMYICLTLGFGGRYAIEPGGRAKLSEIQDDLYQRIRAQRLPPAEELAPHWRGIQNQRNSLIRYIPLWVVAAAGACVLLVTFLFLSGRLNDLASPISARLAQVGLESAVPPAMMAPSTITYPTLKTLLAPEIQAGKLIVLEKGNGKELIRIGASAMFPSGSVTPSAQERPLLKSIALALNQLHGRVIVVGYTNSIPIHTYRFPNNFVLSDARAHAVVKILDKWIDNPGRLEYVGAGDSDPIAQPPTSASNRRIEITFIPEA